jgi:hypothetical protein
MLLRAIVFVGAFITFCAFVRVFDTLSIFFKLWGATEINTKCLFKFERSALNTAAHQREYVGLTSLVSRCTIFYEAPNL